MASPINLTLATADMRGLFCTGTIANCRAEMTALNGVVEAARIAEQEMRHCFQTGLTPTNAQCVTLYGILCNANLALAAIRGGAK